MSPVLAIDKITRPEDLVEYVAEKITGSRLGLKYIAKYNDTLLPQYPAALIMAGPLLKQIHGLHTFIVALRAEIYLFHGALTEDKATRSYNDLQLASNLVEFLERDLKLGGRIISGYVESETPGVNPPRSNRSESVISTRIVYFATQETRF